MLGAHTDVTALKEKENELTNILEITKEQNERLKNFAYIVSHNLRSHSNKFEILLSLFFSKHPEFENNEFLSNLNKVSKDLKETIFDLNEIVSINTTFQENLKPINLSIAVNKSISNLVLLSKSSETSIENKIEDNLLVQGIQSYVDSILFNILTNGIKYRSTERDSIVTISSEKTKEYISLTVADNGIGIDLKKYGAKLFGLYNTFHGNKDAKGLGLFITRNHIEAIGGKIEVQSEVGQGTTFKIFFKYNQKS
jgi:hypothetical protein